MPDLIKCPACEKDVSPLAVSCPNCGNPIAESKRLVDRWVNATDIRGEERDVAAEGCAQVIGYMMLLLFWAIAAGSFPKTVSILTMLACIGYVLDAKQKGKIQSVRWKSVTMYLILSIMTLIDAVVNVR